MIEILPDELARRLRVAGSIPRLTDDVMKARKAHHDAVYLVESAMRDARRALTPEQYDALLAPLNDAERAQVRSTAPRPER